MANPPTPFGIMVHETVCLKIDASIKSLFAAIDAAKLAITEALNAAKSFIRSIVDQLNPVDTVTDALSEFNSQVNELIPDPTDYNYLNKIIQACSFLNTSDMFGKPASMLKDAIDGILGVGGYIDGMLEDLADALTIPEFNVAIDLSAITDLMNQLGVLTAIDEIKKMIQCLSAVCGMPVSAYIIRLQDVYRDFYITDTGELDVVRIVSDAGVPFGKRGPLIEAVRGVKAKKSQFGSILDNAVDGFRALGR